MESRSSICSCWLNLLHIPGFPIGRERTGHGSTARITLKHLEQPNSTNSLQTISRRLTAGAAAGETSKIAHENPTCKLIVLLTSSWSEHSFISAGNRHIFPEGYISLKCNPIIQSPLLHSLIMQLLPLRHLRAHTPQRQEEKGLCHPTPFRTRSPILGHKADNYLSRHS